MSDQSPAPMTPDYRSSTTPSHGGHVHHAEMPEEHPERHEHTDVSVRGIWITVGSIVVVAALVHVMLYVVFFAYEGAQAREDDAERRSAITDMVQGPPEEIPRLQGIHTFNEDTPSVDQLKMEQENRRLLNSYATTDNDQVRIPINRAMDIALERNLFPARGATTTVTTQPAGGADAGN
ncbi:MAG TPA: hypothetical protein VGR35_20625 [Tepidisphaeraceae bacterium]|nr:hypothetical protein [Tepidisphaeraceae bacterium]